MDFKGSDRLKLRVDALNARLREVSAELSALKGTAVEVRERLHAVSTEALLEGRPQPEEVTGLRADLTRHEAAMPALEEQEQHLKRLHFEARRDHLKQLRQERPGQWLVLE